MAPGAVVGIGVDATATSMLPVDEEFQPLCLREEFRKNPHAWLKMWKHHSAQPQAERMNLVARKRGESFLENCGGRISGEWLFPKIYETLEHAPGVYAAAHRFIEVADWLVWLLTGVETRNSCMAGFKAMWSPEQGFPARGFFAEVDPRLAGVVEEKMGPVRVVGQKAGCLTEQVARMTGLLPGTAVGVANTDGHHVLPAIGITGPHEMAVIAGTSMIHMLAGDERLPVPGVGAMVKDTLLPGFYGYETGQPTAGDMLSWLVDNMMPPALCEEAAQREMGAFELLGEKAALVPPGAKGLLVLDWWNGNRSILADMDLSGLIVGLTLRARCEEIYRAMLEAIAFGTRLIIENFRRHGVPVKKIVACGGLSHKAPLAMQILADVTSLPIRVSASLQTPALGAAMFGACAAGRENGGYADIFAASSRMSRLLPTPYIPDASRSGLYDRLYEKYCWLHDTFGRGNAKLMSFLKQMHSEG